MARYRNCVFTWNNPDGEIDFDEEHMEYLVYQEEIGENGTYHFQGYVEFKTALVLATAKNLLGGAATHIERRRGTQAQAITYCKKEDTRVPHTEPYEFGEKKSQGKRCDLENFKDDVLSGKRKRDLLEEHFEVLAKYPKFYDTLQQVSMPVRTTPLQVTLLIGPTGLGKTRMVYDGYVASKELWVCPLSNGTQWYDSYDMHKVVLLDDFAGAASHMSLGCLLRLLDRYPVLAPVKGSHTWWLPDEIFVTTNILPKLWYKWEGRMEQYDALARRFTKVVLYYTKLHANDPGFVVQQRSWWTENKPDPPQPFYHHNLQQ